MTRLLTLAIIFLLIVFYTYEVELPREEVKAHQASLLGGKSRADIQSIAITNAKGSVTLKRVGNGGSDEEIARQWELGSVAGSVIDVGAMNSLLSAISDLKLDQPIPAAEREVDLGVYGLKEPEAVLKLVLADSSRELRLGKLNRYVSKRYVQLGTDGDLFLSQDVLFSALNKSSTEFRSHTPIVFSDGDVAAVKLQRGAQVVALQVKDQEWWLTEPISAKASATAFSDVARELRNLRAEEFIEDASGKLKEYGLEPGEVVVELQFAQKDRQPMRVRIGKRETAAPPSAPAKPKASPKEPKTEQFAFFVDGQPSIYTLKSDPIAQLIKSVDDLREKRLFTFAGDKVRSVRFQEGTNSFEMERRDGAWKVGDAEGDTTFISSYLFDLAQLEATTFSVPTGDLGLSSPSLTITVTLQGLDGKDLVRSLFVGKKGTFQGKDVVYVAINSPNDAFAITADSHRRILPKRESFVKLAESPSPSASPAPSSSVATPS